MSLLDRARALRAKIEALATENISDDDAPNYAELFPAWDGNGHTYVAGDRVRYGTKVYSVLQPHTSQPEWTPTAAVSLFAEILIPDPDVIPEWVQPESTNPYMRGDRVTHNGFTWESLIDNNVWEPGVYGWAQIEA